MERSVIGKTLLFTCENKTVLECPVLAISSIRVFVACCIDAKLYMFQRLYKYRVGLFGGLSAHAKSTFLLISAHINTQLWKRY